ncbi:MAG: hypothetical protein HQL56_02155 [Magnetococcales bacterium]|nr:hypothetical protein [Magnetococcales bacterium]
MGAFKKVLFLAASIAGLAGTVGTAVGADPATGLQAARVKGDGPILDPSSPVWNSAKPVTVNMAAQTVATPQNANPSIKEMTVRSVHNGEWLGVLIEWKDPSRNDTVVVDRFGDQVAIELPVVFKPDAPANPMMGAPGERVNIIQWRAAFQADLDRGRDIEVHDLYPNAVADLYPDQVLKTIDLRPYAGAVGMDNPVAKHRASPVLDQLAEGFGSLTVKQHQEADGKGYWRDGMWHVVITAPMGPDGANGPRLLPGANSVMAFAVWDGSEAEVGSRKAWSDWVPLSLDR